MPRNIAVVGAGNMGSGVASVLTAQGVSVPTLLAGRSAATEIRAHNARMAPVSAEALATADMILSILPPGTARAFADQMAPVLARAAAKPIFVDCNAVSPATVTEIASVIAATGCPFVDAAIIGPPPKPGSKGTTIYASGPAARHFAALGDYGLTIKVLEAPIGAASALKMSFAGITKGLQALAAAMILAAERSGAAPALHAELMASERGLLDWITRLLPGMPAKAYRWVAEMEEISAFADDDPAAATLFQGAAKLYERLASGSDLAACELDALTRFTSG